MGTLVNVVNKAQDFGVNQSVLNQAHISLDKVIPKIGSNKIKIGNG